MRNIFLHISQGSHSIKDQVLATIVRAEGSTPQKAGSSALFDASGQISGTVGGGILEGKVSEIARKSLNSKKSGLYRFMLDNNAPSGEDALCGGSVTVLVDPELRKSLPVIKEVNKSISARVPGVLITVVSNIYDESVAVNRFWSPTMDWNSLAEEVIPVIKPIILEMLAEPETDGFREMELVLPGEETASLICFQVIIPPPRLIIAGAGHISKALSAIAQMLEFNVTVIDDRREYANPENFPKADHIVVGDIGKSLSTIEKSGDTFIVIVTRGHRDDSVALKACINSGAAYIGMIGSRNKVELMHKEFIINKWANEAQWSRIFAPVGIEINSQTVGEIAISIAAQLIQIRNKNRLRKNRPKIED
jgi:xanthine dehydrogenase accessory factor